MTKKNTAYFISDAHLGDVGDQHVIREQNLLAFCEQIQSDASHLFVMGDLFDFWVEYKHAIRPEYFKALHGLYGLVEKGVEIHYLVGNHDFAMGSFLTDSLGIHVHPRFLEIEIQGKKLYLTHGDGIIKSDWAYRLLSRVLRNPVNQWLYRLIHPNLGIPLAVMVSGSSRYLNHQPNPKKLQEYIECSRVFLDRGNDIVVLAHTHYPQLEQLGSKCYCNTGNWSNDFSYAKLSQGEMSLWQFNSRGNDQPWDCRSK